MIQPFEVSYTAAGRGKKMERNVIGVLTPTVLAQCMGLAKPIFVEMGDVRVDWDAPQSEGYKAIFPSRENW